MPQFFFVLAIFKHLYIIYYICYIIYIYYILYYFIILLLLSNCFDKSMFRAYLAISSIYNKLLSYLFWSLDF
jgi:hypothetical protein